MGCLKIQRMQGSETNDAELTQKGADLTQKVQI